MLLVAHDPEARSAPDPIARTALGVAAGFPSGSSDHFLALRAESC